MLSIFGLARASLFNHRDPNARRQLAHGGRKIDVLIIHHKAENASARPTSKAVEGLSLRTHMERWRFLLMKWAKRPEIRSRSFERKIGADHLDDIVRRSDLFDGFRWDSSHEMLDFSLVWFGKRCQTYAVRGRFPNMRKLLPIC